jgi:hypothetical protein
MLLIKRGAILVQDLMLAFTLSIQSACFVSSVIVLPLSVFTNTSYSAALTKRIMRQRLLPHVVACKLTYKKEK